MFKHIEGNSHKLFIDKDNKCELLVVFSLRGKDSCQLLLFPLTATD